VAALGVVAKRLFWKYPAGGRLICKALEVEIGRAQTDCYRAGDGETFRGEPAHCKTRFQKANKSGQKD
jgi:hypothetical protein